MDVQSVSKAQKTSLFTNVNANAGPNVNVAGDNSSPENAFSSLLNLVGVKFNTGSALGTMESKLMHSNDAAHALQTDARDDADQNAPRAVAKPKASKSDDKDSQAANNDDSSKTDDTAAATGKADAAAADQTQVAVQAAAAATVTLPVAAAVQAGPVVAAVQETAVAAAATGPVEAVAQTAVAAVDTKAATAAATAVTAPEQIAAAAPVVQQAAGPVVEQTKTADTGPKAAKTLAAATTATDTASDAETATAGLNTVTAAKATTAKTDTTGPKETRSAAAVDQSQSMSRMLGDDNKAQVQVQVSGKTATTQTFAADANPYNVYSGYTGAAEGSTANGQVGDATATNALVQSPKAAAETQAIVAPVILPPQLQSQQAPAPAAATATINAAAPIQALESSSGAQNNSQNDAGFEAFGGHAQSPAATGAAGETKAAAQTATDRPQVTSQEIVDQIKVVINRATKAGMDKVTIQLKPLELGRIDVKLEMSADHKVSVTVTADKPETLSLLKNDSHTLERTLNEAGLRTDSANLHFNLRSDSDAQQADQNGSNQGGKNSGAATADAGIADLDTSEFDYAAAARTRGGVDTFA